VPAVNGSVLLLPDNVDPNQGFQESLTLPNPAANVNGVYKATGTYYEVVQSVFYQLVTDATAGTRQAALAILDNNNATLAILNAPVAQSPNTTVDYTYGVDVSTVSGAGGLVQTVEIPQPILFPGWSIDFGVTAFVGAADKVVSASIITLRFGSGTAMSAPVLVATPLLL
jgi:hypothetical protein